MFSNLFKKIFEKKFTIDEHQIKQQLEDLKNVFNKIRNTHLPKYTNYSGGNIKCIPSSNFEKKSKYGHRILFFGQTPFIKSLSSNEKPKNIGDFIPNDIEERILNSVIKDLKDNKTTDKKSSDIIKNKIGEMIDNFHKKNMADELYKNECINAKDCSSSQSVMVDGIPVEQPIIYYKI